jgi:hypothetical protein
MRGSAKGDTREGWRTIEDAIHQLHRLPVGDAPGEQPRRIWWSMEGKHSTTSPWKAHL